MVRLITAGLEDKLAKALPFYMVPTISISITRIPMTATRKMNRRRLREIGKSMSLEQLAAPNPSRAEKRTPTTAIERRL
jgi:acyl-CoA synthetase (AMP-forming)/AMP-acid ligase II